MKYAVIQIAGKQYRISAGDTLTVNKLDLTDGQEVSINDVLLTADGDTVQIGAPLVSGAIVKLKATSTQKGDKLRVAKYKAKSRYRKVRGHRQLETTVEVISIS